MLKEVKPKHSRRDLQVAATIVKEATDAMSESIFFVDPEWAKEVLENDDDSDSGR